MPNFPAVAQVRRRNRAQPATFRSPRLRVRLIGPCLTAQQRVLARLPDRRDERGDVPGWVMVTLMTAGLVVALWAVAGPRLEGVFNDAMDRVVGGP
jgi:hypothetical protein